MRLQMRIHSYVVTQNIKFCGAFLPPGLSVLLGKFRLLIDGSAPLHTHSVQASSCSYSHTEMSLFSLFVLLFSSLSPHACCCDQILKMTPFQHPPFFRIALGNLSSPPVEMNNTLWTIPHFYLLLILKSAFLLSVNCWRFFIPEFPEGVPGRFACGFGRWDVQGSNPPPVLAHPPLRWVFHLFTWINRATLLARCHEKSLVWKKCNRS